MYQWGANRKIWTIYRMGPSPNSSYPKPRDCKSATTDLSTSCAVVKRPDGHCDDDLVLPQVAYIGYAQLQLSKSLELFVILPRKTHLFCHLSLTVVVLFRWLLPFRYIPQSIRTCIKNGMPAAVERRVYLGLRGFVIMFSIYRRCPRSVLHAQEPVSRRHWRRP